MGADQEPAVWATRWKLWPFSAHPLLDEKEAVGAVGVGLGGLAVLCELSHPILLGVNRPGSAGLVSHKFSP
jgi:hypothetical protein